MTTVIIDTEYQTFLTDIKKHYRSAQMKAVHAVNREMIKRTDGPIGIAEYHLMHELPKELEEELLSIEILESELAEKIKLKK